MIKAYVLLTLEVDKAEKVIKEIKKKIKNVIEAEEVTGPYDAIVSVKADNLRRLAKEIIPSIYKIDGVIDTTTAIVIE
ncbi:MAG: Lrp/AsnC ligand binding domain-containing protein [Thermoplasmata archaeon]|nr:Lrp/AsnC ligand binding domain-containing protein [Thermoplasmata archaeon]